MAPPLPLHEGLPAEPQGTLRGLIAIFINYCIVSFSRILFRATDIGSAYQFVQRLFDTQYSASPFAGPGLLALGLCVVLHYVPDWVYKTIEKWRTQTNAVVRALAISAIAVVLIAMFCVTSAFIYSRF